MSPFEKRPPGSQPARPPGAFIPSLATFVLCLAIGAMAVVWRARSSATEERSRALAVARGLGASLEAQLNRAVTAATALGAASRAAGGPIPNFQQLAGELHASFPELTSLESQPAGVVSDIVPRAGNQRAIGFNVLKDPAYRVSAEAAQRQALPVAAALVLYNGEPGLVIRVPVSQKGLKGDSRFWGFVAISVSWRETLRGAGLEQVSRMGYDHAVFASGALPGQALLVERQGIRDLGDTIRQAVRVQNLDVRLALRRQGGWIHKSQVALDCVAVILAAAALSLLVNRVIAARQTMDALKQSGRLVEAESTRLRQMQEKILSAETAAQGEVARVKTACDTAQNLLVQREQELRGSKQACVAAEASLAEVRASATDLQARLDNVVESHQQQLAAKDAELSAARGDLEDISKKLNELETALAKARHSNEAARSKAQVQDEKAQSLILELQGQLEKQKAATEQAVTFGRATQKETEAEIRELRAKLTSAEQAQAKVIELQAQLSATKAIPASSSDPITICVPQGGLDPESPDRLNPAEEDSESEQTPARRKRPRRKETNQIDLFGGQAPEESAEQPVSSTTRNRSESLVVPSPAIPAPPEPAATESDLIDLNEHAEPEIAEEEPATTPRRAAPARPVDSAQLRRATNEIFPLLTDRDPGAKDCFRANRAVFRSGLGVGYEEFEHLIKEDKFEEALELLIKSARRHGIHL
jgi:sensor domain CHASE-containing protein